MQDYLSPRLNTEQISRLSTLSLAHIGDAAYELMVRTWLGSLGPVSSRNLHKRTVEWVRASAQAQAAEKILKELTQEELSVFMRGRNTHIRTLSKNTDRSQYQQATGLEALFGFLYLCGERVRMNRLFERIIDGEKSEKQA